MMSVDAVCVASRIGMLDRVFEIMRQFFQKEVLTGGIKGSENLHWSHEQFVNDLEVPMKEMGTISICSRSSFQKT